MNFSIWLILAWKSFKWSIYGAIETQCFSYGASRKYERAEFENRSPLIFGESASLAFPRIVLFPSFYCLWLPVHRFASERHGSRSSVYYYTWYSHVPRTSYKLLLFLSSRRFTRVLAGLIKVSRQREYFENPELQTWSWLTQGRPESEPANRFFGEDSEKKCKITPSRTPLVQRFKSALPDMALSSLFCELNRHFQRENYISIFWHSLVWMNFEVLICNKLLHIICNLKNKDRKWDNSLLTFNLINN